jgi:anti-sigma regulatory factor (Ser/Thr protein kinase)
MERRVTLASVPEAPSQARAVVDHELRPLATKVREDATLLVSELVSNAVRHASTNDHPGVELRIRTEPGRIRVVVSDPGGGFEPAPRLPTAAEGSGWGLYLVDRIADRWGVLSKERNEVWFEIDLDDTDERRSS